MIDNNFSISMYNIAEQFCLSQNINIAEMGLDDIINIIKDKIFNFDYTMPATSSEEEHKNNIEKLFINKYMFNDFGCYSFGEWRLYFQQAFNEMIEKYTHIWKAVNGYEDINLLYNRILNSNSAEKDEYKSKSDNDYTTNSSAKNNNKNVYFDTPQDEINQPAYDNKGNPIISDGKVMYRQYATNMTKNEDNNSSTSHNNGVTNNSGNNDKTKELVEKEIYGDKKLFEIYKDICKNFDSIDNQFVNEKAFRELFSVIM